MNTEAVYAISLPGWVLRKAATNAGDALRLIRLLTMAVVEADGLGEPASDLRLLTWT